MEANTKTRRYRFGIFEVDAGVGELRRQGLRVKLGAQPLQVLLLLLDRPGDLLTREEIAGELWPDGTFVDFEHGVNSALNRIREALGDSAAKPRFVETLARKGYRFIAPVERLGEPQIVPETVAAMDRGEPVTSRFLASTEDLPRTPYPVVQTLFVLLQVMYIGFYVGALANLAEIEELFAPLTHAELVLRVMVVSAAVLIPVRLFVISAAMMHAPRFRGQFLTLWWGLLAVDVAWALAPFLLLHHMSFGLALACVPPLVYSPFAQRSLVLMGAGRAGLSSR